MTALYAYAIVPATLATTDAPAGLDDAPVSVEAHGDVGAVISSLSGDDYDPEVIADRSADLAWLGERAAAHDRVMIWVSDHGPTIPLPPFSLFRDAAGVRRMLADRAPQLTATLRRIGQAREYTVRLFRIDAELTRSLATLSPAIAELEARVAAATPGQRYLLERKLDAERAAARNDVTHTAARDVLAALSALAQRVAQDPLPAPLATAPSSGGAALNASFLIAPDKVRPFQEAVTALIDRLGTRGFRFEFTGPWPPYHFVRDDEC